MIKHKNWYGFDHSKVCERYSCSSYLGDLCLNDGYTVAVYEARNPDRSKGHKDYVLLDRQFVRGMDAEEFATHSTMDAIVCLECETMLVSVHRHDYNLCGCPNEAMIDGGKDYLRCGAKSLDKILVGKYDLLHSSFKPEEEQK